MKKEAKIDRLSLSRGRLLITTNTPSASEVDPFPPQMAPFQTERAANSDQWVTELTVFIVGNETFTFR
jgi:hypothetical protein